MAIYVLDTPWLFMSLGLRDSLLFIVLSENAIEGEDLELVTEFGPQGNT